MLPPESKVDYDRFMEFLLSNKLCCNINFDVEVFGHKACWDCFKKIRPEITDIHLNWDITSVSSIRWYVK